MLLASAHGAYPVVSANNHFEGAVTRKHLLAVLRCHVRVSPRMLSHEELTAPDEEPPEALEKLLEQCLEPAFSERPVTRLDLSTSHPLLCTTLLQAHPF